MNYEKVYPLMNDFQVRGSCLTLEMNEFRCYEAQIEEKVMAGGCPAVVA